MHLDYYDLCKSYFRLNYLFAYSNCYTLNELYEKVQDVAFLFRRQLVKLDRMDKRQFGEQLSASFPRQTEKSIRRFLTQYVVYIRPSDLELLGMLPALKFINKTHQLGVGLRIGLTDFGKKFAVMQNPVIDLMKPESLSKDEIDFLINHIADNLPEEFEHMMVAQGAIKEGKQTRMNSPGSEGILYAVSCWC